MGKIMAVNISEKKGTQKKNVHSARLMEEFGIEKDAHAGKWPEDTFRREQKESVPIS